jgi:hypothetical protein
MPAKEDVCMTVNGLVSRNRGHLDLPPAQAIPEFRLTSANVSQDKEWIEIKLNGRWQRRRLHDYDELYAIPGLYEAIFNRTLKCSSPVRVVSLLMDVLGEAGASPETLRVLDLGAGNGMVGHELQNYNVDLCVGVDIIPEAKEATLRDRPWCYDDYFINDLTDLPADAEAKIRSFELNCLTCVAALGFGDVPTRAFLKALDLVDTPAFVGFNIKEDFVQDRDDSGFAQLIRELARRDVLVMHSYRRYQHRLSCVGEPLYYVAMVATKNRDVPADLLSG